MAAFTLYNPAAHTFSSLTSALLSGGSGISVTAGSISVKYGTGTAYTDTGSRDTTSIAFYDGSIPSLGIGAGLFLTSGDGNPPTLNTQSSYGVSLTPSETDTDLNTTVHGAFPSAGEIKDTTALEFSFTVSDPALTSIKFSLIYASDEYPEFSDSSFVDIAGVYVNGETSAKLSKKCSVMSGIVNFPVAGWNSVCFWLI